jgi:hypothetical protein
MSGSGGGGALSVARIVEVTPERSYHITIGAAGHGGKGDNNSGGAPGEDGGTSSFGSVTFPGAGGGRPGTENKPPGGKGSGYGGDGGVMGYPGEDSLKAHGGAPSGGGGAGDGNGGDGSSGNNHNGHNGTNGGGGGGGGRQILSGNETGVAGNGGDGTPGRIVVKW